MPSRRATVTDWDLDGVVERGYRSLMVLPVADEARGSAPPDTASRASAGSRSSWTRTSARVSSRRSTRLCRAPHGRNSSALAVVAAAASRRQTPSRVSSLLYNGSMPRRTTATRSASYRLDHRERPQHPGRARVLILPRHVPALAGEEAVQDAELGQRLGSRDCQDLDPVARASVGGRQGADLVLGDERGLDDRVEPVAPDVLLDLGLPAAGVRADLHSGGADVRLQEGAG